MKYLFLSLLFAAGLFLSMPFRATMPVPFQTVAFSNSLDIPIGIPTRIKIPSIHVDALAVLKIFNRDFYPAELEQMLATRVEGGSYDLALHAAHMAGRPLAQIEKDRVAITGLRVHTTLIRRCKWRCRVCSR